MATIASNAFHLTKKCIAVSTHVTFPSRETVGKSKVLDVAKLVGGRVALLLAETPFHPVDKHWPDQPADRGTLILSKSNKIFPVEDCQVFAVDRETQKIKESNEVSKEEKERCSFVVGHIIDPKGMDPEEFIDADVNLNVEPTYREELSLHHTACHLAAFALNLATKGFWKKEAPKKDTFGSPNIDQLAMDTSFIFPDRSEDRYRFGKSIKKKGLQVDEMFAQVGEIESKVNALLKEWIETKSKVNIASEGPRLNDTRKWQCHLPCGTAEMPCGGSHVADLSIFSKIEYRLQPEIAKDDKYLFAVTKAVPTKK